jgi:hypothetical protein
MCGTLLGKLLKTHTRRKWHYYPRRLSVWLTCPMFPEQGKSLKEEYHGGMDRYTGWILPEPTFTRSEAAGMGQIGT